MRFKVRIVKIQSGLKIEANSVKGPMRDSAIQAAYDWWVTEVIKVQPNFDFTYRRNKEYDFTDKDGNRQFGLEPWGIVFDGEMYSGGSAITGYRTEVLKLYQSPLIEKGPKGERFWERTLEVRVIRKGKYCCQVMGIEPLD